MSIIYVKNLFKSENAATTHIHAFYILTQNIFNLVCVCVCVCASIVNTIKHRLPSGFDFNLKKKKKKKIIKI